MELFLSRVGEPFQLELQNDRGNKVLIDAAATIGGSGYEFRPMELMAGSLAACMAIDVLAILRKKRLRTDQFHVSILGIRKDAIPSTFKSIELEVAVDSQIDIVQLQKTIDLVLEKYCSVAASLASDITIRTFVKHIEA